MMGGRGYDGREGICWEGGDMMGGRGYDGREGI